jgi:hypothetical protein
MGGAEGARTGAHRKVRPVQSLETKMTFKNLFAKCLRHKFHFLSITPYHELIASPQSYGQS